MSTMLEPALYISVMNGQHRDVTGVLPNRSLDFESSSSQAFSIAGSTFGVLNGTKWTYHVWYKRESTGATMVICRKDPAGSPEPVQFRFNSTNTLEVIIRNGSGTLVGRLVTTATFTDTSNWHQLVLEWDSNNATSADRLRLIHDQTRITSFGTETQPTLGTSVGDVADGSVYMGYSGTGSYFDGKLYQQAWFSNANPDISTLHSGGSPVALQGMTGLISLLNTSDSEAITYDHASGASWTNVNTVVASVDVPA